MAIDYSLETKQGKLFVSVSLTSKEPLQASDRSLLKELGLEGMKKEAVLLKSNQAIEWLGRLARSGSLRMNGRKLVFDPFTQLGFEIVIQEKEKGQFHAEGFLLEPNRREPIVKSEAVLPSSPPCVLRGPLLQKIAEDISFKWVQRVYPEPSILDWESLKKWEEEWKEEEKPFIIQFPLTEKGSVEVWPILELKDRFGAFADLWLDYQAKGSIAYHDPANPTWRDRKAENGWEKDLLETGFRAKIVDASHYYCPMDQVAKSLSFLLDIGWKIRDFSGRQVIRQGEAKLCLEEEKKSLTLRGKVLFGQHELDIKDVAGAFQRREQFLELSSGMSGLLEPSSLPIEIEDFQWENGHLHLPKSHFALAQGLIPKSTLQEVLSLAQGKKEVTACAIKKPGPSFCGSLHPYQKEGLHWMALLFDQGLSGLLADDMGLGKTVQVLAFLSTVQADQPLLIVAPTSLLFHWQREWEKFLPEKALYVHSGKERKKSLEGISSILTSYAILRQDKEIFSTLEYSCLILDEAQTIKNPDSQIAGILFTFNAAFRLAMSGTPIENRAEDLWSLFRFVLPGLLGERGSFRAKIAAAEADRRYIEQTKKLVAPFILRRKKEIVAHDLPPKMEQIAWVEMGEKQRAFYEAALAQNRKEIQGMEKPGRMQILEKILRLRQICCHPQLVDGTVKESGKLERLLEDLEEILEEGSKALVYSQFTSMLSIIRQELGLSNKQGLYLDGNTQNREEVVKKFQEDPEAKIFLISLKAGGVGLNLTKADYVLLYDPWWNEAVERQAIDRAYRLGRKAPVIARRYVTALSIEEKMMRLKEHKRKLMGDLLENLEEGGGMNMEDLLLLLE
jgi:superfamily II DNA or RNA helicase